MINECLGLSSPPDISPEFSHAVAPIGGNEHVQRAHEVPLNVVSVLRRMVFDGRTSVGRGNAGLYCKEAVDIQDHGHLKTVRHDVHRRQQASDAFA